MSKEKKIEELTNELIRTNSYGTLNAVAEHLYNAGYRKQIEAEWILNRGGGYLCGNCKKYSTGLVPFCKFCGAKMKGGAE